MHGSYSIEFIEMNLFNNSTVLFSDECKFSGIKIKGYIFICLNNDFNLNYLNNFLKYFHKTLITVKSVQLL